jgi:hypothetical protein
METRVVTLPDDVPLPALVNAAWGVDDDVRINGVRLGTGYADYGSTDVLVSSRTLTIDLIDTVGGNSGGRIELNLVSADTGFDGDPSERFLIEDIVASAGTLRYFDGALWPGDHGGGAVGLRRDATGGLSSGAGSPFGKGWSPLGAPIATASGSDLSNPAYVSLAFGGNDTRIFRNVATTGSEPMFERVGVSASRDQLTMANGQFTYLTTAGSAFTFERCDDSVPASQRGQMISRVDSSGHRVDVAFNGDGTTFQRTTTLAGESTARQIETYVYLPPADVTNPGGVSQIDITQSDGALLGTLIFEYYGDGAAFGTAGDLASVAVQDASGALVDMRRYRYTAAPNGGSLLQYAFDAEALNYALSEERDPLTDSSASMAEYAKHFFEYDTQGRVTRHDVQTGPTFYVGIDTFTYTYTANLNPVVDSDLDWRMKITETRPFGVERIVYSNGRNQPMLEVIRTSDGGVTQQYGTYTRYDTRGDVIWRVSPENITLPQDLADIEQYPDLFPATSGSFPNISTSTGQVKQLTLDPAVLWGGVRFDFENHWSVPAPPPGVADYALVAETRVVSLPDSVALPAQVLISWEADDDVRLNGVRLGTGITNAGTRLVTVYTRDLVLDLIDTVGGASGGTVTLSLNTSPDTPPVYASFVDGRLSITGSAASETIIVGTVDVGGVLQVAINDVAFAWGILAQDVTSIVVYLGDGNDAIDLSTLVASGLTGLTDGSVTINGGFRNDTIYGTELADTIDGLLGDDILYGLDGNDLIYGHYDNDLIYGGGGNDTIYGGLGTASYYYGDGEDVIHGDEGDDIIHGEVGNDQLFGDLGDDQIVSGYGDDVLDGGDGSDFLAGGMGNDAYLLKNPSTTGTDSIEEAADGGVDALDLVGLWQRKFVSATSTDTQPVTFGQSVRFVNAGTVESILGNFSRRGSGGVIAMPGEPGLDLGVSLTFGANSYAVEAPEGGKLVVFEVDDDGYPLHSAPGEEIVPVRTFDLGVGQTVVHTTFPSGANLAFYFEIDHERFYSIPGMTDGTYRVSESWEPGMSTVFGWALSDVGHAWNDLYVGVTVDSVVGVTVAASPGRVIEGETSSVTFTFTRRSTDAQGNEDPELIEKPAVVLWLPIWGDSGSGMTTSNISNFTSSMQRGGFLSTLIPAHQRSTSLTFPIPDNDSPQPDYGFGVSIGSFPQADWWSGTNEDVPSPDSYAIVVVEDDDVPLSDGPFGVQNNGIVSADDGQLWVYAAIPEDVALQNPTVAVTFDLLHSDGTPTGVTGTAVPSRGLAYTTLVLPGSLLQIDPLDPAASTYRVRATYGDLTADGSTTTVQPGLAASIDAVATVTFASQPSFSYSLTDSNAPFLRDFSEVGGRVSVTATVRDKRGNLVADDTPVAWGTVADAFAPTDIESVTEGTRNGQATFTIHSSRIAPVARLSITADHTTIQGFLSGGELTVTLALLDLSGQPALDQVIDLDERWWFSTRSETVRVRATATRSDGSPVGAGVAVKFHDTKRLMADVAVLTDSDGVAMADLFVPNDGAGWSILGRNVVTATTAGYSASATIRIQGSISPPVEIEFSTPLLAGNVVQNGFLTLPDPRASGLTATEQMPVLAEGTIILRNLVPGTAYRLEVPADSPVWLQTPDMAAPAPAASFQPDGDTFMILVESRGVMTGSHISVVKPLLYAESTLWNWFEDPVGYSVRGDGAGALIVGPASSIAWLEQTFRSVISGAVFGSTGLDGTLVGDVGLSLIPGVGVYPDVRDFGKSLLSLLPVDLGLGPFDWREAAISGFGILTEALPMVDPFVDAFRALYKIAKHSSAVMPIFLSIEPLFMKALSSAFDSNTSSLPGSSFLSANGGFSAVSGASLRDIFNRYMRGSLGDDEAKKLIAHVELANRLIGDDAFLQAYKRLAQVSGSKLADDLSTVIDHFGIDNAVRMLKRGDSSVFEFGDGLNAMAAAIRRHMPGTGGWQNTALLDSLKGDPEKAAEIMMSIGRTSRKVIESAERFGSQVAGESDVSQALGVVIGRTGRGHGDHSFVTSIEELQNFANDLETIMDVGAAGIRNSIALIRRFRSDGPFLPTQSGRLLELQEAAAEIGRTGSAGVSYNHFTNQRYGRTDIDLKVGNDLAIEIKQSVARFGEKEMITKFVKYWAELGATGRIELRSFDSAEVMEDKVLKVLDKYIGATDKPDWLTKLRLKSDVLPAIRDAMTFTQVATGRYNFFGVPQ